MRSWIATVVVFLGLSGVFIASARAESVNFEGLEHGRIVNTQYASQGLTVITAVNTGGGPNLAAAFDSEEHWTQDPDLEGPPWSKGNLAPSTVLGNILIIAENSWGSSDGILNYPDDEGTSPAGSLFFEFNADIDSFGFDAIDVEGPKKAHGHHAGDDADYNVTFYDDGNALATVGFDQFITPGDPFFDASVKYGNNSANRITPITVAALNAAFGLAISAFDMVEIHFGGSTAVDNIYWTFADDGGGTGIVPEPGALSLSLLGLVSLAAIYRRRLCQSLQKN
ncbi:PEP-CTERM sorting domain-containing protein [Calycomorphotria hydatis]|uniref:PEP-CTERM protein-sorting domain-containing protein n=1 Tax=Calycomorphotria hydatis TaxID=2528027 RepID=A0A517T3F1_9PLAN|nr:PEP-CTERM sorting domain-containing protein [Calycomorphotria hydatis]QDT62896.1 hypothetical protein V22_00940 [Calycomorphotria hydatis]